MTTTITFTIPDQPGYEFTLPIKQGLTTADLVITATPQDSAEVTPGGEK